MARHLGGLLESDDSRRLEAKVGLEVLRGESETGTPSVVTLCAFMSWGTGTGNWQQTWAISRTRRWKGSLRMRSSVDFW